MMASGNSIIPISSSSKFANATITTAAASLVNMMFREKPSSDYLERRIAEQALDFYYPWLADWIIAAPLRGCVFIGLSQMKHAKT